MINIVDRHDLQEVQNILAEHGFGEVFAPATPSSARLEARTTGLRVQPRIPYREMRPKPPRPRKKNEVVSAQTENGGVDFSDAQEGIEFRESPAPVRADLPFLQNPSFQTLHDFLGFDFRIIAIQPLGNPMTFFLL